MTGSSLKSGISNPEEEDRSTDVNYDDAEETQP